MRRFFSVAGLLATLLVVSIQAKAQQPVQHHTGLRTHEVDPGRFELYGGYSYARASAVVTEVPLCVTTGCQLPSFVKTDRGNLNGWDVAGAVRVDSWLSVVADVTGHYGVFYDKNAPQPSTLHYQTYLAGAQLAYPARFSPFVRAMAGEARETIIPSQAAIPTSGHIPVYKGLPGSNNSIAGIFGGGVDYHLTQHLSIRLAQIDYLLTRFSNGVQNQALVSTGLVLHF